MALYDDYENVYENMNMNNNNEVIDDINDNYNNIDKHIRILWDTVIVPYLEDFNERQILDQLTTNDYDKFYIFMIKNNPICQQIIEDFDKKLNN